MNSTDFGEQASLRQKLRRPLQYLVGGDQLARYDFTNGESWQRMSFMLLHPVWYWRLLKFWKELVNYLEEHPDGVDIELVPDGLRLPLQALGAQSVRAVPPRRACRGDGPEAPNASGARKVVD